LAAILRTVLVGFGFFAALALVVIFDFGVARGMTRRAAN